MTKRSAVRVQWAGAVCLVVATLVAVACLWGVTLGVSAALVVAGVALLFFGWAGEVEAAPASDGST